MCTGREKVVCSFFRGSAILANFFEKHHKSRDAQGQEGGQKGNQERRQDIICPEISRDQDETPVCKESQATKQRESLLQPCRECYSWPTEVAEQSCLEGVDV